VFFISLFLQRAQGWPPTATGWGMAPQFLAMAVVSLLFGRLAACCGAYRLMVLGYGLIGLAMLGLGGTAVDTPYPVIAGLLAGLGIGMGLAIPATGAAMMATAPRERSGMASATMNALRQMGMTIGIALLGTLMGGRATALLTAALDQSGVADAPALAAAAVTRHDIGGLSGDGAAMLGQAFAGGFSLAMLWAGAAALLAAGLLVALRGRRRAGANHPVVESLGPME
jgi:MFS family permease